VDVYSRRFSVSFHYPGLARIVKIAAYVHLNRVVNPTGVGKHLLRMVEALHARKANLQLLVSERQARVILPQTIWPGIRSQTFPLPLSLMQRIWVSLNWPPAERFCGALDWLYCPAESYVPVRGARLAVTVHDVHPFETELPWSQSLQHRKLHLKWKVLFARILQKADLLLTVSEFTKRRMIERLGADEKRIVVIGNGVEELYFQPAPSPRLEAIQQRPYVVVVGGLSGRKGGDIVLAVAKLLAKRSPDVAIVVAGQSDFALASQALNYRNVISVGYTDDRTLHSLLAHSICLLFPSRYEGFGIPAAEAMAAGTPTLISNQPALLEISGEAGIVVTSAEVATEEIVLLNRDEGYRSEKIRAGQRRAARFRWSQCADRLESVLAGGF
jgi:glycosyltransferase involved in cell wall biosynthesis